VASAGGGPPALPAVESMGSAEVLVARTGRLHQRYDDGVRLVAGCIPYRLRSRASTATDGQPRETYDNVGTESVEVMLISRYGKGDGLLFPKGGWETDETAEEAAIREAMEEAGVRGILQGLVGTYEFDSKSLKAANKKGLCRGYVYALAVTEQLEQWPEQNSRRREWMSLDDAMIRCRKEWMRKALEEWRKQLVQPSMNGRKE